MDSRMDYNKQPSRQPDSEMRDVSVHYADFIRGECGNYGILDSSEITIIFRNCMPRHFSWQPWGVCSMPCEKITTDELISLLKSNRRKVIEASLDLGFFSATHLIWFGGKIIYDTGIDSNQIKWNINDFRTWYERACWKIDQLIG